MRIVYVVDSWPHLSETFVLRELLEASKRYDILVLALERSPTPGQPEADLLATKVKYLGDSKTGLLPLLLAGVAHPVRFARALRAAAAGREEGTLRRFSALVAQGERLRDIGVHRIHAHFARWATASARVLSAWTGAPFGFTAHAYDVFEGTVALPAKAAAASWRVSCSVAGMTEILRRHGPAVAERFTLVRHGVDLQEYAPGPGRDAEGPLRILAVGNLVEKKGFDVLVEALGWLTSHGVAVEAQVMGGGPLSAALVASAKAAGAGQVTTFTGAKPASEVRRTMREWAHVLAVPSRIDAKGNRDGLPNVLGEGMACGLAVVGTAVGGIPEMLGDNATGLVVPAGDAPALAQALARLANDPDLRRRLGDAARVRAEQMFDAKANLQRFFALIEASGTAP